MKENATNEQTKTQRKQEAGYQRVEGRRMKRAEEVK